MDRDEVSCAGVVLDTEDAEETTRGGGPVMSVSRRSEIGWDVECVEEWMCAEGSLEPYTLDL